MKLRPAILAAALSGAILAFSPRPGLAQTNGSLTTTDTRDGTTSRIVSSDQVDQELDLKEETILEMLRSERPEYPKLSPEIRRKLHEFKLRRDLYLKEQERLIKAFKGATDTERDVIRERLRERRLQWLEQSRTFRENARERLRDLVRELPKHQEALEAAREKAREQARDQAQEIRERPRTD